MNKLYYTIKKSHSYNGKVGNKLMTLARCVISKIQIKLIKNNKLHLWKYDTDVDY